MLFIPTLPAKSTKIAMLSNAEECWAILSNDEQCWTILMTTQTIPNDYHDIWTFIYSLYWHDDDDDNDNDVSQK